MFEDFYKHKRFKDSLKSSVAGLIYTVKEERNAKIILVLGLMAFGLAWLLKITLYECAIIMLTVALVFICEVFNTLIENVLNLVRKKQDTRIKVLKDMASAAVLLSALASIGVAVVIFLPKILKLFK